MHHRPVLALAFTAVFLVAGCLGALDETDLSPAADQGARVLCLDDDVCNLLATVEPATRQANELSLAVNPTDPLNMVASGKDYTPDHAADCVWDGIYVTHDGGATWKNANLPNSPGERLSGEGDPAGTFGQFWCATDPVVRFGPDGTLYWTVMPYQCDPVTGSKVGRGVVPQGGFNDWLWSCSSMYVLRSDDGGDTWPVIREVAFGERLVHDRQWISASPDGKTVVLCWRWVPTTATATGAWGMACSVSEDRAETWTEPAFISDTPMSGPVLDHGPDGTVWMVANSRDGVVVLSSADGGHTWTDPTVVTSPELPPSGGEHGRPVLRGSEFRISTWPHIAVDRSDGPFSGRVYVTWMDHATGDANVYLAWSDDGVAWSDPVRVHDDGDSPHDQFLAAVSVGPDGIVDVSWYDRRDDPGNHVFHVYYTYSTDGGATFAPNLRVTDVPSDEEYSRHQNGMIFLGDYRDAASTEGAAHMVWVDTRHEKADVMVATVLRA